MNKPASDISMDNSPNSFAIVAARARQRFPPDYTIDIAFPVCWPVYKLVLDVMVQGKHKITTTGLFFLRLCNLGICELTKLAQSLGLPDNYMADVAAELLREDLIERRPDQRFHITTSGKELLANDGEIMRPTRESRDLPYDPLTKQVPDIDVTRLLTQDEVKREGAFVIPSSGSRPRLSELRIDEIRSRIDRETSTEDQEILDILDVKRRKTKIQYRNDIIVVKMNAPDTVIPAWAVYQYNNLLFLEKETAAFRSLAEKDHDLIPAEMKTIAPSSWISTSVTPNEQEILEDIERLGQEERIFREDMEELQLQSDLAIEQSQQENSHLKRRISILEKQIANQQRKRVEDENRLKNQTQDSLRLIQTEEHRPLLYHAIRKAQSELILVSAWINRRAFDDEICRLLNQALNRGVTIKIAWGMGTTYGADAPRNILSGRAALKHLEQMASRKRKQSLIIKETETHEKFIICDDVFCAWGSFNWLSYRGAKDRGYRRETSSYSTRAEDIATWQKHADTIFAN